MLNVEAAVLSIALCRASKQPIAAPTVRGVPAELLAQTLACDMRAVRSGLRSAARFNVASGGFVIRMADSACE